MSDESEVLCSWSARSVHPIVLLYVVGVFLGFVLVAHFVVHSGVAVKALLLAAVGVLVPLVPSVLRRVEYRLTEDEIRKRKTEKDGAAAFATVVKLDELDRIVPMRRGLKFFKSLDEPSSFKRFWKRHISDGYSGEVHVEKEDRERVLAAMRDLEVIIR